MRRVIGQKSSSDKGADYAVVTARPVWAERMLRSIGDDKLLQFEARFADHVSLQFAQADYNQQEREAAYAHFLEARRRRWQRRCARNSTSTRPRQQQAWRR